MTRKTLTLAALASVIGTASSSAAIAFAFEFNGATAEGWTHNTPGTGGSQNGAPSAGGGVITGAPGASPTADIRVLHNPDLVLDTMTFSNWDSIEVRFRELASGTPVDKTAADSSLYLGIQDTTSPVGQNFATISINGSSFVRENPLDTDFWYTATLDISGAGTDTIGQIRFDPIANLQDGKNYQIDYVRVNAVVVPEPSAAVLCLLGSLGMLRRRR